MAEISFRNHHWHWQPLLFRQVLLGWAFSQRQKAGLPRLHHVFWPVDAHGQPQDRLEWIVCSRLADPTRDEHGRKPHGSTRSYPLAKPRAANTVGTSHVLVARTTYLSNNPHQHHAWACSTNQGRRSASRVRSLPHPAHTMRTLALSARHHCRQAFLLQKVLCLHQLPRCTRDTCIRRLAMYSPRRRRCAVWAVQTRLDRQRVPREWEQMHRVRQRIQPRLQEALGAVF